MFRSFDGVEELKERIMEKRAREREQEEAGLDGEEVDPSYYVDEDEPSVNGGEGEPSYDGKEDEPSVNGGEGESSYDGKEDESTFDGVEEFQTKIKENAEDKICPICQRSFPNVEKVQLCKLMHKTFVPFAKKPIRPTFCYDNRRTDYVVLKMDKFQCHKCDSAFIDRISYRKHLEKHDKDLIR